MAETNLLGTHNRSDEEKPPQAHRDQVADFHPADPDSGGDGEEYSSGSDRSFEGEYAENPRQDSTVDPGSVEIRARGKRKRRHGSHGSRRQKGGSRHKHKGFHPYPPKDEVMMKRKSLEIKEKENAAAVLRREDGDLEYVMYPAAPFNSTQYLMDEHSVTSPGGLHKTSSSSKLDSSSPYNMITAQTAPKVDTIDKTSQKENKEFAEIYTTVHAESLQSLPKEELVKHYMNLEQQVAVLQKKVAEQKKKGDDSTKMETEAEVDKELNCDSASVSDTNSLSSANEEFVDLTVVNQPTISVGDDSTKRPLS